MAAERWDLNELREYSRGVRGDSDLPQASFRTPTRQQRLAAVEARERVCDEWERANEMEQARLHDRETELQSVSAAQDAAWVQIKTVQAEADRELEKAQKLRRYAWFNYGASMLAALVMVGVLAVHFSTTMGGQR